MDLKPLLILLSENTRGHVVQSRGIRDRMQELATFETVEFEVPHLKKIEKIRVLKLLSRRLPSASPQAAERWLAKAGGRELFSRVAALSPERRPLLFLSAGSTAAAYCLALAKRFRGKSCTVMTPSVFGVKPFDMAVVPKHDRQHGGNILVTLGAPNSISPQLLEAQRRELLSDYPPHQKDAWGILVGGEDLNYSIAPLWVNKVLPALLNAAAGANADLYITTSRRTQAATEMEIAKLCGDTSVVRMLLLASQDSRNPVPGILGHCSRVFCTEDSVSMISEAVTAGVQTAVVTVGHHHGVKRLLQEMTEWLVDAKLLSTRYLWGVPRFNRMIEDFENQNYLCRISPRNLDDDLRHFLKRPCSGANALNEAGKAAKWILNRWLP